MLDIVIAVQGGVEYTRRCYDALMKYTDIPFTIFLVDSTPVDRVQEGNQIFVEKPNVVYSHHTFTSLAAKWNIGIRQGNNPYVAVVNNDAYVSSGWTRLFKVFEETGAGLVTPLENVYIDQRLVKDFVNEVPLNLSNYESRIAEHYEKFKGLRGVYAPGDVLRAFARKSVVNTSIPYPLCGAFMILKRKVLEEVGLYDERYVAYYEDMDMYCKVNLRHTCVSQADTLVYHERGKTTRSSGIGAETMQASGVAFASKWHSMFQRIREGKPLEA
jgi:GT2 family glycosyltransferase